MPQLGQDFVVAYTDGLGGRVDQDVIEAMLGIDFRTFARAVPGCNLAGPIISQFDQFGFSASSDVRLGNLSSGAPVASDVTDGARREIWSVLLLHTNFCTGQQQLFGIRTEYEI